jgi:hypothetical protein
MPSCRTGLRVASIRVAIRPGSTVPADRTVQGIHHPHDGLYLLVGVPVTVCVVATVAWEGSLGVPVFG